jgi:hypothetical protein
MAIAGHVCRLRPQVARTMRASVDLHRALERPQTSQRCHQVALTVSENAGDADDLPAIGTEVHVAEPGSGQPGHRKIGGLGAVAKVLRWEGRVELPPYDQRQQLVVSDLVDVSGPTMLAVP